MDDQKSLKHDWVLPKQKLHVLTIHPYIFTSQRAACAI